jgi:2-polyprenyl-3-methyl-5-hydroxy-6-metoxy-1,4-benzoquinol methylase
MKENQNFDTVRAESFANSLIDTLNKSALSFMRSIGHRSGLFDTMSNMKYATSAEIADAANLNERYIREWLGAMVTGGIVDYSTESRTYKLPEEHSAFLTRIAGADNFGVFMQYPALLGKVEDEILTCFREGGGVSYSKFHRFHEVMAEDSGQSVLSTLESHILPLVPGLTKKLEEGIRMLDVGCGSGRIINKLASLFPKSQFEGMDLSSEAIGRAMDEADNLELTNVRFQVKDLSDFPRDHLPELLAFLLEIGKQALGDGALGVFVVEGQEGSDLVCIVIHLDPLINDHVVIDPLLEDPAGVVDIGHAAAHAGAEIVAHRPQDRGDAAGHVFTAIVAAAFHHGDRA